MNKAILVRYKCGVGAGGSSFTASDSDGNRIKIPYPYELGSEERPAAAAKALCKKMGWDDSRMVGGELKTGEYAFVDYPRGKKLVDAEVFDGLLAALKVAENFMAGFEGDELQEGIDDMLKQIRTARAKAEGITEVRSSVA